MKQPTDNPRRLTLRLLIKVMIWIAIVMVGWILFTPFVADKPIEPVTKLVSFDVSDMNVGEVRLVEWAGKPLIIANRLPEWEADLISADPDRLRDPDSEESTQPVFAQNPLRSSTAHWFVSLGLGTGMGCALRYVPASSASFRREPWPGGFLDACDSSRFDLSGRVFRDQSARQNLPVPDWNLKEGKIILLTR